MITCLRPQQYSCAPHRWNKAWKSSLSNYLQWKNSSMHQKLNRNTCTIPALAYNRNNTHHILNCTFYWASWYPYSYRNWNWSPSLHGGNRAMSHFSLLYGSGKMKIYKWDLKLLSSNRFILMYLESFLLLLAKLYCSICYYSKHDFQENFILKGKSACFYGLPDINPI